MCTIITAPTILINKHSRTMQKVKPLEKYRDRLVEPKIFIVLLRKTNRKNNVISIRDMMMFILAKNVRPATGWVSNLTQKTSNFNSLGNKTAKYKKSIPKPVMRIDNFKELSNITEKN